MESLRAEARSVYGVEVMSYGFIDENGVSSAEVKTEDGRLLKCRVFEDYPEMGKSGKAGVTLFYDG